MPIDTDTFWLLLVLGARLLAPLAIPFYPLPAGIAALVIDGIDQTVLAGRTNLPLDRYQNYDKALDIYYLAIAYLSTLRNWTNLTAVTMARALFLYRLVGSLLFELLHARAILLLFPNTFEYFFLFYEAVRLRWNPRRLTTASVIGAAFAIWVLVKVPQEYWIHIAQLDATDAIKEHLLGVPADASWGTALAANVPVVLATLAVVVLLLAGARWLLANRLPPPDWPVRFAADGHGVDVTPAEALAARRAAAERFLDGQLAEKVALVGLITVIFSQILPSATVSAGAAGAGALLVLLANTLVSEWLTRQEVVWRSPAVEFVAVGVVNAVVAAVVLAALSATGRSLDRGSLIFCLLLLTLLVTLYDRFRPFHDARVARARSEALRPVEASA